MFPRKQCECMLIAAAPVKLRGQRPISARRLFTGVRESRREQLLSCDLQLIAQTFRRLLALLFSHMDFHAHDARALIPCVSPSPR